MGGAELNIGGGTLMSMTGRGGGAKGGGVLAFGGASLPSPGNGDREPDLEPLGVLGDLGGVEVGVWGDRGPGPSISYRGESAVGVPGVPGVLEAGVSAAEEWTGESRLIGGGWVRVKLRSGGSTLVPGAAR